MNASNYYNHILAADRNRALMARVLINSTEGLGAQRVDIAELRELSKDNWLATEAFLTWRHWNRSVRVQCDERMRKIASS